MSPTRPVALVLALACAAIPRVAAAEPVTCVPVFELQQDASKYFEIHDTDADRIDRIDPRDLAFNVAAYATVAWALAEGPSLARLERTWPAARETVHPCEWKAVP